VRAARQEWRDIDLSMVRQLGILSRRPSYCVALRLGCAPLAIIPGSADAVVSTLEHSCRLHQQAPESTLAVLPGLGHMIHYPARGEIGRAVDRLMGLARKRPVSIL
jgi:pimeloyl-ACP methyl ester carboxylesterase